MPVFDDGLPCFLCILRPFSLKVEKEKENQMHANFLK
jgi:hypothetical protein